MGKKIGLCGLAIALAINVPTATAQVLEEIVVNARKKEESLQDVPVTLTALGSESLERLNINNIKDIASLVPTLQTAQRGSGAGASIFLRGIGSSSIDASFDSAVALNFDDVVSNSARLISQGNLDMAQVEVLKGPQSLYFGKGASAGVVSIQSADPTQEFEAFVRASVESEEGGQTFEGVVSGALSETLSARLAARSINIDEVQLNTQPGVANRQRGEESRDARLTLLWEPSDRFSANLKISVSEYENDGSLSFTDVNCADDTAQLGVYPQASALAVPILVANTYDCQFGDQRTQVADQNSIVNQPGGQPGNNNGVPFGSQELELARLKLDWQISDALTLTSVTSNLDLSEAGFDCFAYDTNGSNCIVTENTVDSFSQELRLAASINSSLEVVVGAYYQNRDLLHVNIQDVFSVPVLLSLLTGSPEAARDPFTGFTIDWIKEHPTAHETFSLFSSLSWNINDAWNLTVGGRYSDEQKENLYQTPFVHAGFQLLLPGAAAQSGFSVPIDFADTNFSPELSLSYQPTENLNYYFAYKTGFKSGGVSFSQLPVLADFFALAAGDASALIFDSETVEGFELGLKSLLLDGDLRLNATLYDYDYENLQNQQFNSLTFVFTTFNAGDVDNRGLEVDAVYQTDFDGLSLRGAFAYTDSKYSSSFVNIAGVDLNGQTRQNAPELTFNMGFDYIFPIGDSLEAYLGATASYTDDYTTSTSQQGTINDFRQDSFWRGDIVASIGAEDGRWNVALVGRNITDEIFTIEINGRPGTIPNAQGALDQAHFINRGRQLFLEGTYRF